MSRRAAAARKRVVDEVRSWVGTPFLEQASIKGPEGGCDCKGLPVGVARELGFDEAAGLYAGMADYDINRVDSGLLKRGIAETLTAIAPGDERPGDILLCRFGRLPAHLAILTVAPSVPLALDAPAHLYGDGRAVHAQIASKAHVKETALRVLFAHFPLDSIWRFRACL